MENWLKAKTLGLPRWAWVTVFSGAVILGLYLRKRAAESEGEAEVTGEETALTEQYPGTEGFGAAGLVGPAAGQVVPVEAPYLPEGFVDVFGSLAETITQLGAYITEHQNVVTENVTGGGAPDMPSGEFHEPTTVTGTSCPTNIADKIRKNRNEIVRLQGEIDTLQREIQQLTNYIQAHPNAKQVSQWKAQRSQDQTNITGKRAKVTALSSENASLRKIPGCDKVVA